MNRFIRDIASFSASERRGVFVLILIIIILGVLGYYFPAHMINDKWIEPPDSVRQFIVKSFQNQEDKFILQPFDPNTATKSELTSLHIPFKVVGNILSYRKAGGCFTKVDDLKKIYGVTDSLFEQLKHYIKITKNKSKTKSPKQKSSKELKLKKFNPQLFTFNKLINAGIDPKVAYGIIKYREAGGVFTQKSDLKKIFSINKKYYNIIEPYIEITSVDSSQIKEDPIIELNSSTIKKFKQLKISQFDIHKVIKYRTQLGGYYSKNQLYEIFNLDSSVIKIICDKSIIDISKIKKIDVQKCTLRKLAEHPYLNYEKAKTIIRYRNFVKHIDNMLELVNSKVIEPSDTLKLKYYIKF